MPLFEIKKDTFCKRNNYMPTREGPNQMHLCLSSRDQLMFIDKHVSEAVNAQKLILSRKIGIF